ncbi:hypothetical protein [Burkholderia cenocepacia]|uniref:hypothetical protein n=1 Tax=Burkholderia cenocepacia TaxID=95486 RepID=UPI001FC8605F|nr:hypothetical protein [Burkholderia cenocepacia]
MLDLIQRSRMGQAVRAGQHGADSSSTVQSRFDRAGPVPAPAGLDRTRVRRIIRRPFVDGSGSRHVVWLQCRPVIARLKGAYRAVAAFGGSRYIREFSIPEADASAGIGFRRGIEIANRKDVRVIPVNLIEVFLIGLQCS